MHKRQLYRNMNKDQFKFVQHVNLKKKAAGKSPSLGSQWRYLK